MKRLYIGLAAIALLGYSASSMSSSRSPVAGRLTGLMNRNMAAMTAEQYYAWKQEVDSLLNKLQGSERMGFERRIPGLQAKLSDDVVDRILAKSLATYNAIVKKSNDAANDPVEKAIAEQEMLTWAMTDAGLDFIAKKESYNDKAYQDALSAMIKTFPVMFLEDEAFIQMYLNIQTDVKPTFRNALISNFAFPYTLVKTIMKRLDPSTMARLMSGSDVKTRSDVNKTFEIARNLKSIQDAKNYMTGRLDELDITASVPENVARADAIAEMRKNIEEWGNNIALSWRRTPIFGSKMTQLKKMFNEYDYAGISKLLIAANKQKGISTDAVKDLSRYASKVAIDLIKKYASDTNTYDFLSGKIGALSGVSKVASQIISGNTPSESTVSEYVEQKEKEAAEATRQASEAAEAEAAAAEAAAESARQAEAEARQAEEEAERQRELEMLESLGNA